MCLSNYRKDLENLKPSKKQLKAFLLQQTFYSVDEYLSHVQAIWNGILEKVWYWTCVQGLLVVDYIWSWSDFSHCSNPDKLWASVWQGRCKEVWDYIYNMVQSVINCYIAMLHGTQLFWYCLCGIVLFYFNGSVLYVGLCYVWCIQSHMCGWLNWNWKWNYNKFISHFKQLYHSNITVFYYVHWIGLCTEIVVLLLYVDN